MARTFIHPTAGRLILSAGFASTRHIPLPGGGGNTLTFTDFSRDRIVFDTNNMDSLGVARIPVSGTATSGDIIQGRVVSLDDGGKTTTAWADIVTAAGGTWFGTLPAPRNTSWIRPEFRLKHNTAITATTTKKVAAGHTIEVWGQSELAYMYTSFGGSNVTASIIPVLNDSIRGLKNNKKLRGRTSTNTLTTFNGSGLGAGASWNSGTRNLSISSGTHNFVDTHFDDLYIEITGTAVVSFTQCKFTFPEWSTRFGFIRYIYGGTCSGFNWNDVIGPEGYNDINPFLAVMSDANQTGNISNNYVFGLCSDAFWPHFPPAGTTIEVKRNFIHYTRNLPAGTTTYNSGTSYVVNNGVLYNGYSYICAVATTGNAPTGTTASNTWWTRVDPHLDWIYLVGGNTVNNGSGSGTGTTGVIDVNENYFLGDSNEALVGATNFVRVSQTESPAKGDSGDTIIRRNRFIRQQSIVSVPLQLEYAPGFAQGTFRIYHNIITSQSSSTSNTVAIAYSGSLMEWGPNLRASDGATYTTPASATSTISTADTSGQDDIQIFWHDRSPEGSGDTGVQHQFVSNSSYLRPQFTGFARTFQMSRPGEKASFAICGDPGRGFGELVDDTNTGSYWIDDLAVVTRARAGGHPGVSMSSWYASPSGLRSAYGNVIHQLITGKRMDGTPITTRAPIYSTGTTVYINADHLWSDIYDYTKTRWQIYGPHRRDPLEDMQNSTLMVTAVGGQFEQWTMIQYQDMRDSVRSTFPNTYATFVSADGVDPINVEFGYWNAGQNDWWDNIHPSYFNDGSKRFAELHALTGLKALDLVSWVIPKVDNAYWAPGGTYMEFWSSAGAITTTRLARGLAAMPTTYSHRTTVFGVEINGVPAQSATIVNGRVRVVPNSGTFNSSTVITFGNGAGSGIIKYPQDLQDGAWLNYPIVNVGQEVVEGVALKPRPSATILASTL